MKCYADVVIDIANKEVGYLEKASNSNLDSKTANAGNKNWTKYARDIDKISGFYNGKKNGYAWCDVFVDWCFVQAFGVDNAKRLLCQPSKSLGAGCVYSMRYYKNKKQFYSYPQAGDQIFFKDSDGDIVHTGLVIDVKDKYVYTIEGNTSSASGVVANGGCVREKKYAISYSRIAGYGRPAYDKKTVTVTVQKTVKVGDIVNFTGNTHYTSANASKGTSCKPGKAKVTATYNGKHPYHLVRVSGGGSTVYGWVDAKYIGASAPAEKPAESKNYQCIITADKSTRLWTLAQKYLGSGSRYKEIMKLNGMKNATVYVGQKIKIPNK